MGATTYWSVEECRWVEWAGHDAVAAELTVPQQREDEAAQEPVDA
jgi:hypothetical protein